MTLDALPTSAELIDRFLPTIKSVTAIGSALTEKLKIVERGNISTHYAPFDYVRAGSSIVVVGLTPGQRQMEIALNLFRDSLADGKDIPTSLVAAKLAASFGGPMRLNLVAMLDDIGIGRWLGIRTCSELFLHSTNLAHFTSVLRYPVFLSGKNYSGQPFVIHNAFLRDQVVAWFASELNQLNNAIFVPLGGAVESVLIWLADQGHIEHHRILSGLPHPSGANAERISYFLRRKSRAALSKQTNPDVIDRARDRISSQVLRLPSR